MKLFLRWGMCARIGGRREWSFEEVRGKRNGPERVNGEIEVYKADIETPSTVKFAGEELVKGRTGCHDSSPLFFFAIFSPPFLSGDL